MIELPRKVVKSESQNPKKLLIYGRPKIGKSSLIAGLENNLSIDLEKGHTYLDSMRVEANSLEELIEIGKSIKASNDKEGKNIYKYISLDPIGKLEDYAWTLALKNYKNSLVGKNFAGDTNAFKQLPKGAGYPYLWEAFEKLYNFFGELTDHLILIAHLTRSAVADKETNTEIEATDINLTGKLKVFVASDMSAIGQILRKGNQSILSFKVAPTDLVSGSRCKHLANNEIVVAEKTEDGFTYHWDKIFV